MSKRVRATGQKLFRWRVVRLRGAAEQIGEVDAADENDAIRVAIRQYGITNPHSQKSLMAIRVREL
jgi:hypothetical protein